jgi:class 3 adenylate cyclase
MVIRTPAGAICGLRQRGRAEIAGEHKQVTVMFVDIVRSMDLAERLDSERWRGLLDRFFVIASGPFIERRARSTGSPAWAISD